MAKIEAFPESPRQKDLDPLELNRKVKKATKEFFPPWVFTIALSLFWLLVLPGVLAAIAGSMVSGVLAGVGLVLASMLAVLVYDTYSPSWRTIAWAIVISTALCYAAIQIGEFPGRLLMIIIPTGLFVAMRANMNARKLFGRY